MKDSRARTANTAYAKVGLNLTDRDRELTPQLEHAELLAEIGRLNSRLAIIEAERDEYAQQNAELFVLQQVFSAINSSLDINDILSMVLRGVCEALKFDRVVLFDVLANGDILRRLESDGACTVVKAENPLDFTANSTLHEIAGGVMQVAFGTEGDPDAPLHDTKGDYCIAPLVARDVVRGMLYVDGPPGPNVTENQLRVLLDFAAQAAVAVENARLYEEARRLLEETQRLALTDSLTGIPNRRALVDALERELHNAQRYGWQLAFIIFDLDDLKKINDSGGHSVGDQALRRFADVLRSSARKGDIVARYAGDEFVLVLIKSTPEQARKGVERIQKGLETENLSSSIGIAMFPEDGQNGKNLFSAADEALYAAKQNGKNQYQFHHPLLTSATVPLRSWDPNTAE
ncbi:MAG: sensor domain-containing diguanylate cyclase [Candidatus Eremiobacteraeota bacterium]|nr:sensor domain-containing diguanylate cyclase [Candidatus Eremiobacteraeota bacterium]